MTARADLTGVRFSRWTAIEYIGDRKWSCRCDCGTLSNIITPNLTRGLSKSCGCAKGDFIREYWKDIPKTWTKELEREYNKTYREKNAESLREKKKVYREANKERLSESKRNCYKANPEKYKNRINLNYKANPALSITRERLKATLKKEAIPPWVDHGQIKQIYLEARRMTELTGVRYHVDHIVPLKSPFVCGLHCQQNLRVITAEENWRKGNSMVGLEW
jgi:hypothetical protein